jgi:hypothetical protein
MDFPKIKLHRSMYLYSANCQIVYFSTQIWDSLEDLIVENFDIFNDHLV